jgi:aryl-alcohol dehydrogenase-like predicted oxidoreductase
LPYAKLMMNLPTRRLGESGLELSVLGLGTAAMGGSQWADGWGDQDDAMSEATILRAAAQGINWIDTAPLYGLGHAESVIGQAIKKLPATERPMVFTKCGLQWDSSRPKQAPQRVLRPDTVRNELEASLQRLQVDVIDLYQIHQPPIIEDGSLEATWDELMKFVQEGKVRAAGVCNFSVPLLETCAKRSTPMSLQPPFSLLHRELASGQLPWCGAHGTGVIVYRALQSGLLTSQFKSDRISDLPPDDWRVRSPDFQEPRLSQHLGVRDALRPIALRHDSTVESVAISWVLRWSGVTGAIVGARAPEQIDTWLSAASLQLESQDLDEIASALQVLTPDRGPVDPRYDATVVV